MHDTLCRAWSNAHEHPILTTSVTMEESCEHKDMYKRRTVRSERKPLSAPRGVHCGVRTTENSMATACSLKRRGCGPIEIEGARLLLLLTAGRAPLQLPFQMAKEAVRAYTGLRKHRKRSPVRVRWSAAEGSRLASRTKSEASEGIAGRGDARRTAYRVN